MSPSQTHLLVLQQGELLLFAAQGWFTFQPFVRVHPLQNTAIKCNRHRQQLYLLFHGKHFHENSTFIHLYTSIFHWFPTLLASLSSLWTLPFVSLGRCATSQCLRLGSGSKIITWHQYPSREPHQTELSTPKQTLFLLLESSFFTTAVLQSLVGHTTASPLPEPHHLGIRLIRPAWELKFFFRVNFPNEVTVFTA